MKRTPCALVVLVASFATGLAACGSDPVSVSSPVGITLKVQSGDVTNSAISDDKAITTESGNPYGAFISDAQRKLGRDPARIEVDKLTLTLGAQSTNVTALDQVYTGDVDVALITNDTNSTYDIGHVQSPTGAGPVGLSVSFVSQDMVPADFTKLVAGSFKVVIRGPAATMFAGKGASADLQLMFTFSAFE